MTSVRILCSFNVRFVRSLTVTIEIVIAYVMIKDYSICSNIKCSNEIIKPFISSLQVLNGEWSVSLP